MFLNSLYDGLLEYSLNESFFFLDGLGGRVGYFKNKAPLVMITGSYERSCFFGILVLMKASY